MLLTRAGVAWRSGRRQWFPRSGSSLSDEQALAVAFRHLAVIGFAENMAGHITWQPDGQTEMLVNPWGLWWQEITASDICVVDGDARVLRGRWDVTPAIHIHTELHRVRDDARVVIHNHPYYVCVLAALGKLPELVHQTGSLFLDDLCLVDTYDGEIDSPARAADLAARIGAANLTILANHGVIATGRNLPEAVYRAASIERVCKLAYDVHAHRQGAGGHEVVGHGRHATVAHRTGRRRVLGGGGPDDHQGRSRCAHVNCSRRKAVTPTLTSHSTTPSRKEIDE